VRCQMLRLVPTVKLIAYSISTASELNGALVLRHELGHSIIGVGTGAFLLHYHTCA
jgi:hypothetical protein